MSAITTLRTAAGAMARDGRADDAARFTLEDDIAEAFDDHRYKLGAPDPRVVEAAYDYQQEGAADGDR
jgi:hypothetical protein